MKNKSSKITKGDYNILKFVSFKNVHIWDIKRYIKSEDIFNNKYKIYPFKHFISKGSIEKINIQDEKTYSILGVRSYGKGAFINRTVKGNTLKMRVYQVAPKDHLFWCKVDTKKGAFSIISDELAGHIASSNMSFAKIDTEKIFIPFLQTVFKVEKFNSYMDSFITGTTNRKYIKFDELINNIFLPLPSLVEQKVLYNKYFDGMRKCEDINKQILKKEIEIENYLLETLGIEFDKASDIKKNNELKFTRYKSLNRWSTSYLLNKGIVEYLEKGKYPTIEFGEVINSTQYGTSKKATNEKMGVPIVRMNNILNSELILDDLKYIKLDEKGLKKFKLDKKDLLFNRTNSKELVGKTAVFDKEEDYAFASYLIRIKINSDIANVEFFNFIINSKIGRVQIDMTSRQTLGQANVNSEELKSFIFPLPPIDIQAAIVENIKQKKKEIKKLKSDAEKIRINAMDEFEKSLFL